MCLKIFVLIIVYFSALFLSCSDSNREKSGVESTNIKKYTAKDFLTLAKSIEGDNYKSIEYLSKAIEQDSSLAEAFALRGYAKQNVGDKYGAISDLNIALKLNPSDYMSFNNRGAIKYEMKDYDEALLDYQKALILSKSSNDSSACYYNIGLVYSDKRQYKLAVYSFTQAVNRVHHYLTYQRRGYAKSVLNDLRGAISDYDKSIELQPENGISYYNRGLCKIELGKRESGCIDLSKAGELGYEVAYTAISDYCY